MRSPFKFLDAYELKDKDVFFGRLEETEALYTMLFKTPLLLLYGLSGTGKTSLIQCGLASRFNGPNWYPFYIRRGDDINASIHQALAQAMPDDEPLNGSLKTNVGLLFRQFLRPVYLIFDQFEELFILGDREEQLAFARSIRELIDAGLPCKIIFVMREEFIGQLYYLEKEIPSVYDFRLRVEQMGFKQVQEVITGSFSQFNIALEAPEHNLEQMYNSMSAGKSGIQLPYLQVYLDMFWREDYARAYKSADTALADDSYPALILTTAEIEAFGAIENVLARFLQEQEKELQKDLQQRYPNAPANAVRQILDAFVTEEGTKRPVRFTREGEAISVENTVAQFLPDLPAGALDFALNRLAAARLLRERDDALELAHDALAALINQGRNDEQRKINEIKNRLQSAFREYRLSNATEYPSKKLLLDIQEMLEELHLTPELNEFYNSSRNEVERREREEQEEAKGFRRRTRTSLVILSIPILLMVYYDVFKINVGILLILAVATYIEGGRFSIKRLSYKK
ncbi:MAG: ATP-binding protein [Saprospiraceae bacterium]